MRAVSPSASAAASRTRPVSSTGPARNHRTASAASDPVTAITGRARPDARSRLVTTTGPPAARRGGSDQAMASGIWMAASGTTVATTASAHRPAAADRAGAAAGAGATAAAVAGAGAAAGAAVAGAGAATGAAVAGAGVGAAAAATAGRGTVIGSRAQGTGPGRPPDPFTRGWTRWPASVPGRRPPRDAGTVTLLRRKRLVLVAACAPTRCRGTVSLVRAWPLPGSVVTSSAPITYCLHSITLSYWQRSAPDHDHGRKRSQKQGRRKRSAVTGGWRPRPSRTATR